MNGDKNTCPMEFFWDLIQIKHLVYAHIKCFILPLHMLSRRYVYLVDNKVPIFFFFATAFWPQEDRDIVVDIMAATTAFRRYCGNTEMESSTLRTKEEPEQAAERRSNQCLGWSSGEVAQTGVLQEGLCLCKVMVLRVRRKSIQVCC